MGGILFSCPDTRGRQPSLMETVDWIDAAAHGLAIFHGLIRRRSWLAPKKQMVHPASQ
jgi:hypothetical protein